MVPIQCKVWWQGTNQSLPFSSGTLSINTAFPLTSALPSLALKRSSFPCPQTQIIERKVPKIIEKVVEIEKPRIVQKVLYHCHVWNPQGSGSTEWNQSKAMNDFANTQMVQHVKCPT